MIRKATQIAVPVVGSAELNIESLKSEHERAMKDLNEKLGNGWRIFSTHTANNDLTTYLVYVLIKIETEKREEQKLIVRNKWNKKTYEVLEIENGKVTLKRENGSVFTIVQKEYITNYIKERA